MNSELTINDLKETIIYKINHYTKSLYDEADEFENINNHNDLKVWYENIEFTIKSLKKMKLLKYKIDSKNPLTNYEIDHYHMLACKPERIDERWLKENKIKYYNPLTGKLKYSYGKSASE